MTGKILEGYVCPECGGKLINDGFDDFDCPIVNCHCEDCDWEGTERDALDEDEIPYDENGEIIEEGDTVIWTDPDGGRKIKYEVFDKPIAEMVKLSNKYGECEAYSCECRIVKKNKH